MDEQPKSIWKKHFTGRLALVAWLAIAVFTTMLGLLFFALGDDSKPVSSWLLGASISAGLILAACLVGIYVVWPLSRWLFWKHWRRTLFGLACLATLIALFYAEENWRGKHDWEKFKREWEARGEHFDFASVVPPAVPDEQNFAMAPVVASCYAAWLDKNGNRVKPYNSNVVNRLEFDLDDADIKNGYVSWFKGTTSNLKVWQDNYRALAAKTNLFAVPPQPQSAAADVLLALSKYDATVEELRQASQLPQCRFPLNYDTECPAEILLPHLASLKKTSPLLKLRAIAELQNGQSQQALADVLLALRLTDTVRTEPFLISQLVRIAMSQIMLQPIYEGLAEHRWSDAQLLALDAELAKLDFLADYRFSIRGELGMQGGVIDYLIHNRRAIFNWMGNDYNGPGISTGVVSLIPTGWFYQYRLSCARVTVEFYVPLPDLNQQTVSPTAVRNADKVVRAETEKITPYNILEKVMLSGLGNILKKHAYGQASVNLARTAIALERCRLALGEFPESLDALAPQFISKVPHDVIGGQPFKYGRTADGQFVLYSVGWNEKDDGGVVVYKKDSSTDVDRDQGDWVWRYPIK